MDSRGRNRIFFPNVVSSLFHIYLMIRYPYPAEHVVFWPRTPPPQQDTFFDKLLLVMIRLEILTI